MELDRIRVYNRNTQKGTCQIPERSLKDTQALNDGSYLVAPWSMAREISTNMRPTAGAKSAFVAS